MNFCIFFYLGKPAVCLLLSCLDHFLQSLRSGATIRVYTSWLKEFLQFSQSKSYDDLVAIPPKEAEDLIASFINELKRRRLSPSSIRIAAAAVRKFYVRNRVSLNWDWINDMLPETAKVIHDRIYTKAELKQILEKCDERKRAMILFLISTGIRIGALPQVKLRDMHKLESDSNIYKFTIYAGTNEEYTTFCSPECALALDYYLDYRQRSGEQLKPDSPLIREQFNQNKSGDPKPLSLRGLNSLLNNLLLSSGVRTEGNNKQIRHEVMRFHGFRKYCNTMMSRAGVRPVIKEMLLGHKVGLEASYNRPTQEEMVAEYLKAVDLLTISEEKQLRHQVEKLKTDVADVELMKKTYLDMKLEIEKRDRQIQDLYAALYQKGIITKNEEPVSRVVDE